MPTSLLPYNTFGIAATCDDLLEYDSVDALRQLWTRIHAQHFLHIGGGSNLLFIAPHLPYTLLHSRIKGVEEVGRTSDEVVLRVGAGEDWDDFVAYCTERGFYGLENLSLIPGEVGASAVQNIGAYGVEAGDRIVQVETFDTQTGDVCNLSRDECHYAYRSSSFKTSRRGRDIVTHVHYRLSLHFHPVLTHKAVVQHLSDSGIDPEEATASELRSAVIAVRRAKLPDPKAVGSAGSFFMNPIVPQAQADALLAEHPTMPHYPDAKGVKIPAAWLIEQCGWKGRTLGRAGVHPNQPLVLINLGGATGAEVQTLAAAIQADIETKFGIQLIPEVIFVS